jgi:intergrase/recombinase
MCYAQRYHKVLETGDASAIVYIQSGAIRRHAMEALAAYAKYTGCYDSWQQIRQSYSLRWTNGDESLRSLQRFFNTELSLENIIELIKEMAHKLPPLMGQTVRFGALTGLRPSEILESVRLINNKETSPDYYNAEQMTLQHFKFPDIFLRHTKKAFLSFVTPSMLAAVQGDGMPRHQKIITYTAIRHACNRKGIPCNLHLCRKVFASYLRNEGIQSEVVDMLQGRVSHSVLIRHYLVPAKDLRKRVLSSLDSLERLLSKQR